MKDTDYTLENITFHHIVLDGTHYEIGGQIAQYIKMSEEHLQRYTTEKIDPKKYGFDDFESLIAFYEEVCPGLTEELRGAADALGLPLGRMAYWMTSLSSPKKNSCSQVAIRSSITETGHSYLARNYDYDTTRDDRVLCTTRVKGKADHIGFTAFLFGRHDGMNEHGLIASLTGAGIFGVPLKSRGVVIWVAIRAILDSCRDVKDALRLLENIPVGDFDSMVLLDRKDNAAVVEYADGVSSAREVSDSEHFLYSVNHYRLPEMERFNRMNVGIISHSRLREETIKTRLDPGDISMQDIKDLLSAHHPDGLCNHYYNDGFGTLWSVIYDATGGQVEACFCAPTHNKYRQFTLNEDRGIHDYDAVAPKSKERLPIWP